MTTTPVLLCLGDLFWKNGLERNHSMLKNLIEAGQFDRGIYVEPSLWLSSLLSEPRELKKLFQGKRSVLDNNVTVKQAVHFIPFKKKVSLLKVLENFFIKQHLLSEINSSEFVLLINRIAYDLDETLCELIEKSKFTIFDFSDDFREFCRNDQELEDYEKFIKKIVPKVDLLIHVNDYVARKYSHLNSNNMVIRNATNFNNFDKESFVTLSDMQNIKSRHTKIVGYIGTGNYARLDLPAISELVSTKSSWAFVFIGNIDQQVKDYLNNFTNVFYINFVNYDILPDYLNYFDVCTAPMLINDHTAGNDLLKLHDYLAMGKPVVSSDIGGARDLKFVTIYDSPESFVENVESEMANVTPEAISDRKALAQENSWEFRLKPLRKYLADHL